MSAKHDNIKHEATTGGATHHITLHTPLLRSERRLRIALVGLPGAGKTILFNAVSSTAPQTGELTNTHRVYRACTVQIGLDEARVIDLPSLRSLHHLQDDELGTLKYLLWGNDRPPVTAHEPGAPPAPFAPPDLIVQVVDATNLQSHLSVAAAAEPTYCRQPGAAQHRAQAARHRWRISHTAPVVADAVCLRAHVY